MVYGSLCAMRFGISIAQGCVFCWLAKHFAQGTGCGQRMSDLSDLYGLVRTMGTGLCGGYALRKFQNTWLAAA